MYPYLDVIANEALYFLHIVKKCRGRHGQPFWLNNHVNDLMMYVFKICRNLQHVAYILLNSPPPRNCDSLSNGLGHSLGLMFNNISPVHTL